LRPQPDEDIKASLINTEETKPIHKTCICIHKQNTQSWQIMRVCEFRINEKKHPCCVTMLLQFFLFVFTIVGFIFYFIIPY